MPTEFTETERAPKALKVPDGSWVVACRHTDGVDEDVFLKNVLDLRPKTKYDFNYGQKYTIKSSNWYRDKQVRLFEVYVGRIEENADALAASKKNFRLDYPPLEVFKSELGMKKENDQPRKDHRTETKPAVAKKRRAAEVNEFEDLSDFVQCVPLFQSNYSGADTSQPCSNHCMVTSKRVKPTESISGPQHDISDKSCASPPVVNIKLDDKILHQEPFAHISNSIKSINQNKGQLPRTYSLQSAPVSNQNFTESGQEIPQTVHPANNLDLLSGCSKLLLINDGTSDDDCDTTTMSTVIQQEIRSVSVDNLPVPSEPHSLFDSPYIPTGSCGTEGAKIVAEGPDGNLSVISEISFNEDIIKLKQELEYYKSLVLASGVASALKELKSSIETLENKVESVQASVANLQTSVHNIEASQKTTGWRRRTSTSSSSQHSSAAGSSPEWAPGMPRQPVRTARRVKIAEGVTMTSSAYNIMQRTTDERQWCRAALEGVFQEKAKMYRYIVRKKNVGTLKPFPLAFNNVIVGMYRKFLLRNGHSEPIEQKIIDSILSTLSKRARDLAGRRNNGKGLKRVSSNSSTRMKISEPEPYLPIKTEIKDEEEEYDF